MSAVNDGAINAAAAIYIETHVCEWGLVVVVVALAPNQNRTQKEAGNYNR